MRKQYKEYPWDKNIVEMTYTIDAITLYMVAHIYVFTEPKFTFSSASTEWMLAFQPWIGWLLASVSISRMKKMQYLLSSNLINKME